MYTTIIFVQVAASVIVICSTTFEIVIFPIGSGEFIRAFTYLNSMLAQVAMYCWFGHNLKTLSENVGTACYMSTWYLTDKYFQRSIIPFMERAKRPVVLTAAKLLPLTLNSLMMILRSSYSFLAVLRHIYGDK
ncbi:odorant receptor 49b-like [Cylas formicarius]|uniref:odorant receptor 49b-like n=1 Tax=Cylas formicarius TaxID=197179 RepID=UPI002958BE2D|nr:odorant receptor 49b-like [Cylas formicarius]XP_060524425.1 odorant receptor 49b-like [Cylas formicarius]XP_060524426.1 odorant receptor 49b-like [Cylas formicarius]XP_060524427.1 odorant receptor 49b-like [Cylas formicarius]